MRIPVAAKISLAKAGANGGIPGSPTPLSYLLPPEYVLLQVAPRLSAAPGYPKNHFALLYSKNLEPGPRLVPRDQAPHSSLVHWCYA
jgi:hypothetical protein